MVQYHHSIVEYLTLKGESHSREGLNELALSMGIENYRGTVRQNLWLLRNMLIKFGEVSPECAPDKL